MDFSALNHFYANMAKRFSAIVDDHAVVEKYLNVYSMLAYGSKDRLLGTPEECAQKYLEQGDEYFQDFCATQGEEIRKEISEKVANLGREYENQSDKVATMATNREAPMKIYAEANELYQIWDRFEGQKRFLRSFEAKLAECQG